MLKNNNPADFLRHWNYIVIDEIKTVTCVRRQ